jgi:hypothetical protein
MGAGNCNEEEEVGDDGIVDSKMIDAMGQMRRRRRRRTRTRRTNARKEASIRGSRYIYGVLVFYERMK